MLKTSLSWCLFDELRVITTFRASKQIRTIHEVDFNIAPLAVERLVRWPVTNAVDGAEITNNLRVHRIEITQTRSPIHRRTANRRNLSELFASEGVSSARNVIALHIFLFSVEVDRENDAFRIADPCD